MEAWFGFTALIVASTVRVGLSELPSHSQRPNPEVALRLLERLSPSSGALIADVPDLGGTRRGSTLDPGKVVMKFFRSTSSLLVLFSMSACAVATIEEPIEEGEEMDGSGGSGVVTASGGSGVVTGSGGSLVGSGGDTGETGGASSSGGDTGDGDGDAAVGGSASTGGAPGSGGSSDSCSAPEWDAGASYPSGGTQVSYNGVTYESCFYVDAGKTPDTNSAATCAGMPWKVVGPC